MRRILAKRLMPSLWACVFSCCVCIGSAFGQMATCAGTQNNTDLTGDVCSSSSDTSSTASAQATGPLPSNATADATNLSDATSDAGNNSNAMSNASDDSSADATALNSSIAEAIATDQGSATAQSSNSGNATATASSGATGQAEADDGSIAHADGSQSGMASASADGTGGDAEAVASQNSTANATANNGAAATAQALSDSLAESDNNTPGAFVCAYAIGGSIAAASDSAPPLCVAGADGGVAVAVSPQGDCGPVADSPCATLASNTATLLQVGAFNLDFADNIVRLINPSSGANPALGPTATACAMIYVFDADEEMGECCGCPISSAGLLSASLAHDLTGNWAGALPRPDNGAFTIVGTAPNASIVAGGAGIGNGKGCAMSQSEACNSGCDPTGNPGYSVSSERVLLGSIVSAASNAAPSAQLIEVPLGPDCSGDPTNLLYLQQQCGALIGSGSGAGICACPPAG